MELINATGMHAGYTMGLQPDGRELLVVVVKATFMIPNDPKEEPKLAAEQVPLVDADVFSGEPGLSAPFYESDYAPRKPRCDVLLNGSAYAPGGMPTDRVTVSLRVGSMQKSFDVVGNRYWKKGVLLVGATAPEPLTVMPISYNNAFGGVDRSEEDPLKHRWYPTNHAGVGYHEHYDAKYIDGKPLPNTEETGRHVTDPRGKYKPMAFGPVGRAWRPRPKWAGTYDQNWLDNDFPFLPGDFDERYYQSAPEDQQIPHPDGGDPVELINLTPEEKTTFKLPMRCVPVVFFRTIGDDDERQAVIDTILLEPDQHRFMVCWRTQVALKRNIFEIPKAVVGQMSRGWWRARESNKEYYPNLQKLIKSTIAAEAEAE
jgi:hypothetical protein